MKYGKVIENTYEARSLIGRRVVADTKAYRLQMMPEKGEVGTLARVDDLGNFWVVADGEAYENPWDCIREIKED